MPKGSKSDRRFEEVTSQDIPLENKNENPVTGEGLPSNYLDKNDLLHKFEALLKYEDSKGTSTKHISETLNLTTLIIGDDDRTEVFELEYPYNCVCLLLIKRPDDRIGYGTGFLISERCIITAGHCVFADGNWAKEIRVIPGAKGEGEPYGSETSQVFKSVKGWTVDENSNFDHGAIILGTNNIAEEVGGYFGFKLLEDEKNAEVTGYPKDKRMTQWKSAGTIVKRTKYRIYYDIDTLEGNSGSPIYIRNGKTRKVVGIHTDGSNPNHAIRIRPELIELWKEWSKL